MLTQCQRRHRETPTAATWLSQSLRVNMKHWEVQESSFHFFPQEFQLYLVFSLHILLNLTRTSDVSRELLVFSFCLFYIKEQTSLR